MLGNYFAPLGNHRRVFFLDSVRKRIFAHVQRVQFHSYCVNRRHLTSNRNGWNLGKWKLLFYKNTSIGSFILKSTSSTVASWKNKSDRRWIEFTWQTRLIVYLRKFRNGRKNSSETDSHESLGDNPLHIPHITHPEKIIFKLPHPPCTQNCMKKSRKMSTVPLLTFVALDISYRR